MSYTITYGVTYVAKARSRSMIVFVAASSKGCDFMWSCFSSVAGFCVEQCARVVVVITDGITFAEETPVRRIVFVVASLKRCSFMWPCFSSVAVFYVEQCARVVVANTDGFTSAEETRP